MARLYLLWRTYYLPWRTYTYYGAGFLLDLHASCAGNPHLPYVELYPYLDSIWFGEQCECAVVSIVRHSRYSAP
jgi:hypothetical protein